MEANHGDLQNYFDTDEIISEDLRLKWCIQAVEAIVYIHSKNVIHSDLRPDNYILHTYTPNFAPELLLCDFGGSYCKTGDTIIDGGHSPDAGFHDPNKEWVSNRDTDIFALGSVCYTIMTGRWPYKEAGPFVSYEEWDAYGDKVNELFTKREFPCVEYLVGGDIIYDCWFEKVTDAQAIVSRFVEIRENVIKS
jgi:serine/threonine protein kinase